MAIYPYMQKRLHSKKSTSNTCEYTNIRGNPTIV